MAQRNTFREDEELEESINLHDIARVGKYLKPYMAQVARILVVVISMSCIVVAVPYLTKIMIDEAIPNKDLGKLGILAVILAALIVLYEFGLRYRTVAITRVGQLMLKDMRRDIFTHIQTLPFSYFDSRPHGKILIRVVNYVNTLSDTLSSGLINVISDVFTFVITLIVMFVIDWQLALWSLILFPVLIIWVRVLQIFQRRAFQKLSNKQSNLNAYIHESIAGVKTTQTFAQEQAQFRTFQEQQGEVRSAWMHAVHIQFLMWPGVQTISVMTISFIYFVGVMGFGGVNVTTGVLIAFVGYANNFWNPVINIGNFYNQLITCSAYLERIFETLDVTPEIRNKPDAADLPQIRGRVDFNDVVFRYEKDGRNILNLVDFHVEPGRTIALVGPTGAGKTTIINLLSRFYDVSEGLGDDRRLRRARRDARIAAPADGRDAAGHLHLLRQRAREHPLRQARRHRRGNRGGGEGRARARVHHGTARRVRHGGGGARIDPVGRPAPAHRLRARAARRPAYPDPGRGDEQHRHAHRGGAAGRPAASAQGAHELHHRAPPVDDRERGRDLLHRSRPDRRARLARAAARRQGRVLPPLRVAVRDDSRGQRGAGRVTRCCAQGCV